MYSGKLKMIILEMHTGSYTVETIRTVGVITIVWMEQRSTQTIRVKSASDHMESTLRHHHVDDWNDRNLSQDLSFFPEFIVLDHHLTQYFFLDQICIS